MNIWRIALKEIKTYRDVKMLLFMLATPVLLMLILGSVLANNFNGSAAVGDIRVLYADLSGGDEALGTSLEQWSRSEGITFGFERTDISEAAAIREVESGSYTGYAIVREDGIRYYGSSRAGVENGIVQGTLTAFADNRKLTMAVPEFGSGGAEPAAAGEYVKDRALQGPLKPDAIDYYAVVVTTLIIMYSAATAGQLFENERIRNTANRLLAAPVSKAEIFTGKVIGMLLSNTLFTVVTVLISKYMYGANWGDNLGMVFLVLMSQIVFAISVGLGFSYMLKSKASGMVVMTIIQLAAFFGGSYYQTEDNGDLVSVLSRFSPLDWTNDALIGIIYGSEGIGSDLQVGSEAILLNVGISALMLFVSIFIMRRKEGL